MAVRLRAGLNVMTLIGMLAVAACSSGPNDTWTLATGETVTALYGRKPCDDRFAAIVANIDALGRPTALEEKTEQGTTTYWAVNVSDLSGARRPEYEATGKAAQWRLLSIDSPNADAKWYVIDFEDGSDGIAYAGNCG